MDLITDLPPADSFDSILVMVDQALTKGVILIPCNKTITAEDTGKFLLRFYPQHVQFYFYFSFYKSLEQHAMNTCSSIFTIFHA